MKFYATRQTLVWVILLLCAIIFAIWLTGCGAGLRPPEAPGTAAPSVHGGPAGALAGLAVWATWAAGVGLLLCGIAAVLPIFPNKFGIGKIALACGVVIALSFLLGWVANHPALVVGGTALVLLLGAIGYSWLHRADIKKKTGVDLNWLCRVKAKPK